MGSDRDRRALGASRISFEGIVELGGPRGAAFEAQGIDLSPHGMHLRTAYLPELGQELTCRFDAGPAGVVLATGEVVWRQGSSRGGEFGLQFKGLDAEGAAGLRAMMGGAGASEDAPTTAPVVGARVRLHIEGLGQPMRAKVKSIADDGLMVGSELGFLRMGREVAIEDASSGDRRAASIERVQVALNDAQVAELVVSLRYETADANAPAADDASDAPVEVRAIDVDMDRTPPAPPPLMADFRPPPAQQHVEQMRNALVESAARIGPALATFAQRAKTTVEILSSRARLRKEEESAPPRRTTAPAPRGGLHAMGRHVVRDDLDASVPPGAPQHRIDRRKVALGAAGGLAVILAFMALRKPAAPPVDAAAEVAANASAAPAPMDSALANLDPTVAQAANAAGMPGVAAPPMMPVAPSLSTATVTTSADDEAFDEEDEGGRTHSKRKRVHVAPFGGAVSHPNVLKLKMDGPIEKLQGAASPMGFTVVLPERHSLEPAAPLAARDARIASMRVANDPNGAELSVTFKDGVPPYQVRARGDVLEIAITGTANSEAEERPATARVPHAKHDAHGKKKNKKR